MAQAATLRRQDSMLPDETLSLEISDIEPLPPGPKAVIFDLDGTLTETEMIKARSYAYVAGQLIGSSGRLER